MQTDDHNYAIDPSGLLDAVPQPAAISDELGAFVDIEDVSCHTTVVTEAEDPDTASADESEDDYEDSVTRCICDFQHDDGYMICCDQCRSLLIYMCYVVLLFLFCSKLFISTDPLLYFVCSCTVYLDYCILHVCNILADVNAIPLMQTSEICWEANYETSA